MLDLLKIAYAAYNGKDLFQLLSHFFTPADIRLEKYPEAIIWKGITEDSDIRPVVHALTDAFALIGTLSAIDVLGLPCLAVPMWAQYRQDSDLASLAWFGNMPFVSIKWSTAGDVLVRDKNGELVVVKGKSGNAALRIQSGVYCNVRPYGPITVVRSMPCLPYSQDQRAFTVSEKSGIIHSEMNTPGIQLAYANKLFLKMVHETGSLGRVAMKPTQAMEDGINAGLHSWLLQGTRFEVGRNYAVDAYQEHREAVDRIIRLLPEDFKKGMDQWGGRIEQHISDTNYGILLWDLIEKRECIVFTTDLDGDRLTDLLADVSEPLRFFAGHVARHLGHKVDTDTLWSDMGYTTGNGRDMTSVMHRMSGPPVFEQTLGSADSMLLRLLAGDETAGGSKKPYDPRIHYVLMRDAYIAANPGNKKLQQWFSQVITTLDSIYQPNRPGFIEGYKRLKEKIIPWNEMS